ncbi:hypothetical protein C7M84_000928 [Penaeus vannamei]|uniref:BRCT domain-containing protein n=1 Tax=Penaeus vannamei TaxID=6689 RepID=A0A423TV59_PENVA|nr:hypothetical protein C7M84_000928 [Penaeus vannamei]
MCWHFQHLFLGSLGPAPAHCATPSFSEVFPSLPSSPFTSLPVPPGSFYLVGLSLVQGDSPCRVLWRLGRGTFLAEERLPLGCLGGMMCAFPSFGRGLNKWAEDYTGPRNKVTESRYVTLDDYDSETDINGVKGGWGGAPSGPWFRYGGDVLPDYQASEATHLVVDKEDKWPSSWRGRRISPEWIWDSIKLQRLQSSRIYSV